MSYILDEASALNPTMEQTEEERLELQFQDLLDMGEWRDEPQINYEALIEDLFYNHRDLLYRHVHLNKSSKYSYHDEMGVPPLQ